MGCVAMGSRSILVGLIVLSSSGCVALWGPERTFVSNRDALDDLAEAVGFAVDAELFRLEGAREVLIKRLDCVDIHFPGR